MDKQKVKDSVSKFGNDIAGIAKDLDSASNRVNDAIENGLGLHDGRAITAADKFEKGLNQTVSDLDSASDKLNDAVEDLLHINKKK